MQGVVERRLLINYRIDKHVAAAKLPHPFQPQLVNGWAVGGIFLIRLGKLRPRGIPARLGLTSENAAHRFAVEWLDGDVLRTGVYIPERHSAAIANVVVGDRLYPGAHERASFDVRESTEAMAISFSARRSSCFADASVRVAGELDGSRLFGSTAEASDFFRTGSAGFSPSRHSGRLDGLELRTSAWQIEGTEIAHVRSSFFDDADSFPAGTIHLDSALLMRNVPVTWRGVGSPEGTRARAS